MTSPAVIPVPNLNDNYAWCFETRPGEAAVVDPGDTRPVHRWLEAHELRLTHILMTHHHGDHTGGAYGLHQRYGAALIGAAADRHRLPPLDIELEDGMELDLGPHRARVVAVPGHTSAHIAYLIGDVIFAGDVLFAFGCGRVFEGTAAQMWESLARLRGLPAERLCCGHEYTASNLRFARHLLPDDPGLAQAELRCSGLRDRGQPTLPASMAEQRALNPFLRCDDPTLAAQLGLDGRSPAEIFAHIRGAKDGFRG